jgi:hypothetical protein
MDLAIEFSARASLVAVGVRFHQLGLWAIVKQHVSIKQKVRRHTPLDKVLDCFINILAGGVGVVEVNTRVRPDRALQRAFGRSSCAEQSTISDTLNACSAENVAQMRQALNVILRQYGQSYRHDYRKTWQLLDIDMTGMPAGRQGEGVSKGYFAKQPNRRGRQLGRVLATQYDEIIVDRLYDGKRQLHRALKELVSSAEETLELGETKRKQTILRLDSGGGEDEDINWLLGRAYYVIVKGKSWRRALKLSVSVKRWFPDSKVAGREVGWITMPHAYLHPTRQLAIRNRKANGTWSYHVLVFNLTDAMLFALCKRAVPPRLRPYDILFAALYAYDRRSGGAETQNKADKQGLGLSHRNKKRFAAQEMSVLLGQLAHDVVIWTRNDLAQVDAHLRKYGIKRTVRDVLQIDGQVEINSDECIQRIVLNAKHPHAKVFTGDYTR